jgi:large subunit ribosomal protein L25
VSEIRLIAEARTEFGKGGARRTRRAGNIPAVIYGHGADPRHIAIPAREYSHAIKHGLNVLLTLSVDGKDELAITKSIQRDPIRGSFDHVDLLTVRRGEKVTVEVPLVIIGDVAPGGLLAQEHNSIALEAEATHLPTEIEVSVEGLEIGAQITAGDIVLPTGAVLTTDPTTLLLQVGASPTAEQLDADTGGAAEAPAVEETSPAEDAS